MRLVHNPVHFRRHLFVGQIQEVTCCCGEEAFRESGFVLSPGQQQSLDQCLAQGSSTLQDI
eukprot:4289861-Amphidinium_carterae.1